jgi:hypothetical protein
MSQRELSNAELPPNGLFDAMSLLHLRLLQLWLSLFSLGWGDMNVAVLKALIFDIQAKAMWHESPPIVGSWSEWGPDNGWTQGLALTNFSKGRGGTFDKEVPHLLCTGTLQDEV